MTLHSEPSAAVTAPARRQRPRLLLLFGGLLVIGLVASFPFVRGYWTGQPGENEAPELLAHQRGKGLEALSDGNFQVAVHELRAALALARRFPKALSAAERRDLDQLHRQSALLADLLREPLTAILELAASIPEQEWLAVFAQSYRGKTVIFDADVQRTADGQYAMSYVVWDGREPARVLLEEVILLEALPLGEPQRLLFGARLADIFREPTGKWAIRFVPASGVLVTEPAVAEACLVVPVDESVREVLDRQRAWLRERKE